LKDFTPGDPEERKRNFNKMVVEATRFKEPNQLLQAEVVITMYFEIKANEFSSSAKAMKKLLKLYHELYHEPARMETKREAALKVANLLCTTVREATFAAILSRAAALSLNVVSTREAAHPEEGIDLSDEEDVPLSTNTAFSSHRTVLLEEKDELRGHVPISERIKTMLDERTFVREWGPLAEQNKAVAARVVFAYAKKDISAQDATKAQQYLLKAINHRIKLLQKKLENQPSTGGAIRTPRTNETATMSESATVPSDIEVPKYHSSGALMPPPPESGLGKDHAYAAKVVNTSEVQLAQPRVPHPVSNMHAMQCMTIVNEIENMQETKEFNINPIVTTKLSLWLCPPGFSWALTFDSTEKRKQAYRLAKEATEILNMRVRREAVSRDMAQRKMDSSARGTFEYFKYDIEREFQLLQKFRRALFYTELGPTASLELDRIKRLEEASVNTGITVVEKALFRKLMKAKLQAVVDSVTEKQASKSPNKNKQGRNKCQYCKKRHQGGPANCRKRKADEKTRAEATTMQPPPSRQPVAAAPVTSPTPPAKRAKGITVARTESRPTKDT